MNLGCCDCYDESSLKENISLRPGFKRHQLNKIQPSTRSIQSVDSSTTINYDFIHIRSIFQLILLIYRRLIYTSIRIYYNLINFIFRNSLVDQFRSNEPCTKEQEQAFYNYKFNDIPEHLKFNPFILEGYRSNLNFKQSLLSFFYLHNESTNIYSHAFAFLYFLIFMPKNLPWNIINKNYQCLFFALCHVFSTIAPWFGSTVYHLFMNHRNGQKIYNKLLAFDVLAIWITQSIGALLPVYMSVIDFNFTFKYFYMTLYVLLAIRSLYDVLIVGGRMRRRFGFSSLVFMRFVSIYLRTYSNKINNYDDLILQELYPIIGALVSAFRIPEIFSPGTFDLFLNSHNLMHFLVVLATFHLHSSAVTDLILLSNYV